MEVNTWVVVTLCVFGCLHGITLFIVWNPYPQRDAVAASTADQVSSGISQSRSRRGLGPDQPTLGQQRLSSSTGTPCESHKHHVDHFQGNNVNITSDYIFEGWQHTSWSSRNINELSLQPGYFKVEKDGLYLIYIQILFLNSGFGNGFSMFSIRTGHNTKQFRSVDSVYEGSTPLYRPCSISGVAALEKNDILYVETAFKNRLLDKTATSASTYLGFVYLGETGPQT